MITIAVENTANVVMHILLGLVNIFIYLFIFFWGGGVRL